MTGKPELQLDDLDKLVLGGDLRVPTDEPGVIRSLADIAMETYNEGDKQPDDKRVRYPDWSSIRSTVTVIPADEGTVRLDRLHVSIPNGRGSIGDSFAVRFFNQLEGDPRVEVDLKLNHQPHPTMAYSLHTIGLRDEAQQYATSAAQSFFDRQKTF